MLSICKEASNYPKLCTKEWYASLTARLLGGMLRSLSRNNGEFNNSAEMKFLTAPVSTKHLIDFQLMNAWMNNNGGKSWSRGVLIVDHSSGGLW